VQFRLIPYGVIAGTVRDPDGDPLDRVSVSVFRVAFERGRRVLQEAGGSDTNDLGEYRIAQLIPGRYLVRATPERSDMWRAQAGVRPFEMLVPTLYPGVQDAAAAQAVEVAGGARMTGIDIALPRRPTVPVSGHVTGVPGAEPPRVFLYSGGGGSESGGFEIEAKMGEGGRFEFTGVPAGAYTLTASAEVPRKGAANFLELFSENSYKARVPLQVGNVPVRNVQIAIEAGAEITGKIVRDGDNKEAAADAQIRFDNGTDRPVDGIARQGGAFSVVLSRGHYNVDRIAREGFVKSVKWEGRELIDEGLTVTGPGKIELEVEVTREIGGLAGLVSDKDGMPVPGATVVLVPEMRLRSHADLFIQVSADQAGRYRISGPPGKYQAFAWDDVEPGIWWDPEFLRRYDGKGAEVQLRAGPPDSVALQVFSVSAQ
jgi:hypothetical protein